MTNQTASNSANTNLVADENDNINCINCINCSDCSDCVDFVQEMLERHGMLFLSRLQ